MTKLEEIEKRLSEYRGYTAFHSDVNAQEDIRYLLDEITRLKALLSECTDVKHIAHYYPELYDKLKKELGE